MAYRLDPTRSTAHELRRVVATQVEKAAGDLRAIEAEGGSAAAERLHDARKRLKKARAAVRLGRADLGPARARRADRVLRDVGRAVSAARDADALHETIVRLHGTVDGSDLPAQHAGRHRDLDRLADALAVARAGHGTAAGPPLVDLADALDRAAHRVRAAEPEAEGWDALAPGLDQAYRRGRSALRDLGDDPTDEQLHDWRKRAKDLWYHLRLLEAVWPTVVDALVAEADRLATLLGDDHDLALLAERLGDPGLELGGKVRRRLGQLVAEERSRLQAEAREVGVRLYADRPGAWRRRLRAWWRAAQP